MNSTNRHVGFAHPQETWNTRFSGDGYIFGTEPNHFLVSALPLLRPGMRVLVVADGEGRNSVWLAKQGLIATAFDISPVGVEKAKKLASEQQVEVNFAVSDCDSWHWEDEHYDAVVAIFIQFADPAMRARMFSNFIKTLKPGGLLILQGYTPKQLEYKTGGPPDISHLYTKELLRDAFSSMQIDQLTSYEKMLDEGTQHAGMSALIGLIAHKH